MPRETPRRASLLGLGNGVLFVRACTPESPDALASPRADADDYPGTYLAGLYNHARRHVNGQEVGITTLTNLPNAFALSLQHGDGSSRFVLAPEAAGTWRHTLDMRTGVTRREVILQDGQGRRLRLSETRFVSMAHAEMAWVRWSVVPLGWSGPLQVQWGIGMQPRNAKVRRIEAYQGRHLEVRTGGVAEGGEAGPGIEADPSVAVVAGTTDGRRQVRITAWLVGTQAPSSPPPAAAADKPLPRVAGRVARDPCQTDLPAACRTSPFTVRDGQPLALDLAVRIAAVEAEPAS